MTSLSNVFSFTLFCVTLECWFLGVLSIFDSFIPAFSSDVLSYGTTSVDPFVESAFAVWVKALNNVDFPTFGKPTIPQVKDILY